MGLNPERERERMGYKELKRLILCINNGKDERIGSVKNVHIHLPFSLKLNYLLDPHKPDKIGHLLKLLASEWLNNLNL